MSNGPFVECEVGNFQANLGVFAYEPTCRSHFKPCSPSTSSQYQYHIRFETIQPSTRTACLGWGSSWKDDAVLQGFSLFCFLLCFSFFFLFFFFTHRKPVTIRFVLQADRFLARLAGNTTQLSFQLRKTERSRSVGSSR